MEDCLRLDVKLVGHLAGLNGKEHVLSCQRFLHPSFAIAWPGCLSQSASGGYAKTPLLECEKWSDSTRYRE